MSNKRLTIFSVTFLLSLVLLAQQHPYMGKVYDVPTVFYPDVVSTGIDKFNTSMSPDGLTIYYTATSQKLGVTAIAYQQFVNSDYTEPNFVPFASDIPMADVHISSDGKKLFFSTFMDFEGKPDGFNFNIWTSSFEDGSWQSPQPLGTAVTSSGNEFYPITTGSGKLYFTSDKSGNSDIYYSLPEGGTYSDPIALPANINTSDREADAFIARDERYLIFVRVDQEDGLGNSDLYISFRSDDNQWSDPRNMGSAVNSSAIDGSPYVTPDGGYLIFTSGRQTEGVKQQAISNYRQFKSLSSSYQNGSLNFYIMSFDPEEFRD